jgi:phosphoribosylaminoimidazolecarboxamide formyltransferase/IMP cyclohydrolase
VELVSTGGTAALLADSGIDATPVEDVTGFPEMLDGRVKTLHPVIFAGLLARRAVPAHMDAIAAHDIAVIDLVVVNLYPFEDTIAKPGVELAEAVEQIDIGGPSLLRAAAKNHPDVLVVVDPADYAEVTQLVAGGGEIPLATRLRYAQKVYRSTAAYDVAIANHLAGELDDTDAALPDVVVQAWTKVQDMRYGENPHQRGAFYRPTTGRWPGSLAAIGEGAQLHGKELSFNNVNDTDAAWTMVAGIERPAVVAVKHANPCGVGVADDLAAAWQLAYDADPISIFGGIVACNRTIDADVARAMHDVFLEVVIAPGFDEAALEVLTTKANLRLLQVELPGATPDAPGGAGGAATLAPPRTREHALPTLRTVRGGLLLQDADVAPTNTAAWETVTARTPSEDELVQLELAWHVVRGVTSNAIVLVRDGQTVGLGGGQTSRVDAVRIAIEQAGERARGSVLASDAFFPMPDSIELAAAAGITAVVQPGGSKRDADVIDAADAAGLAMVTTSTRHFRH